MVNSKVFIVIYRLLLSRRPVINGVECNNSALVDAVSVGDAVYGVEVIYRVTWIDEDGVFGERDDRRTAELKRVGYDARFMRAEYR
jgi:hypothetical protein